MKPSERISPGELERRYAAVRARMRERGLEVLLVSGIRFVAAAGYLRYLTNWAEPFGGEVLIFPAQGDPTFMARTSERTILLKEYLGINSMTGCTGAQVAQAVKDMGFKKVGLCGLRTMVAEFYVQLSQALPGVELVEAADLLDEVRMIKSEEELRLVRKSANLTDIACQMFAAMVRPGRREAEVFVELDHLMKRLGAETTYFMMSADPKPVAKFLDLATDTYEAGDIVLFNAEVQGPGGYYTQLERTFCLGEPNEEVKTAYAVCRQAEERAVQMLRPGTKVAELHDVIGQVISQSGHKSGLHAGHSQGLDIFERPLLIPGEQTELAPGMIIVLHPHVLLPSGGGVWIGDTYQVTDGEPVGLQLSGKELGVILDD